MDTDKLSAFICVYLRASAVVNIHEPYFYKKSNNWRLQKVGLSHLYIPTKIVGIFLFF